MIRRKACRLAKATQLAFGWKAWGGARRGAGRKPTGERAGVSHQTRKELKACEPLHVTMRVLEGLPSLRKGSLLVPLHECFERSEKAGFRVCHFSIQENHFHLIVEADGKGALSSGMQALCTSIARRMNRELGRKGRFFSDRYHARALTTPTEVRNALRYVLHNTKHHGKFYVGVDWFSSGLWFTGWIDHEPIENPPPIAVARTWLLEVGWKRAGGRLHTSCRPS